MPEETIEAPELVRAESRLPRWMAMCGIVALLALLVRGRFAIAAGFAVGGALGILNYYWLREAVEILARAGQVRIPKSVLAKFLLRYPLAFGLVFVCFRTRWLPPLAVLGGLFVPLAGVLIEAIVQLGKLRNSPPC
jgi:hypothetical protein